MAIVYGTESQRFKTYIEYEIVETNNQVTITLDAGIEMTAGYASNGTKWNSEFTATDYPTETLTGQTKNLSGQAGVKVLLIENKVLAWEKAREEQTKTISYWLQIPTSTTTNRKSTVTLDVLVSAKAGGMYVGEGGVAKTITRGYIGVDGVARTISKIYVGVDGVAKRIM